MNGYAVAISLGIEGESITQNPTPLQLLGPSIEPFIESGTYLLRTTYGSYYSAGACRFDHPLYLAPKEKLNVALTHQNLVPGPIQITIAFGGRLVRNDDVPRIKKVPYFASWLPPVMADPSLGLQATSSEKDLANMLPVPLNVTRMVGKIAEITSVTGAANYPTISTIRPPDYYDGGAQLNIQSHEGINVTPSTTTPWGAVFPAPRRTLEVPHKMNPGAFYRADLNVSPNVGGVAQFGMAIVGWRGVR